MARFGQTRCDWCQMTLGPLAVTMDKLTFHATPTGNANKSCVDMYRSYVKYITENVDGPTPPKAA